MASLLAKCSLVSTDANENTLDEIPIWLVGGSWTRYGTRTLQFVLWTIVDGLNIRFWVDIFQISILRTIDSNFDFFQFRIQYGNLKTKNLENLFSIFFSIRADVIPAMVAHSFVTRHHPQIWAPPADWANYFLAGRRDPYHSASVSPVSAAARVPSNIPSRS